jgi:hypothetical protein
MREKTSLKNRREHRIHWPEGQVFAWITLTTWLICILVPTMTYSQPMTAASLGDASEFVPIDPSYIPDAPFPKSTAKATAVNEVEPNDDPSSAPSIPLVSVPEAKTEVKVSGSILTSEDEDYYVFEGKRGDFLKFSATADYDIMSGIFTRTGDGPIVQSGTAQRPEADWVPWVVPNSGSYVLKVWSLGGTGEYSMNAMVFRHVYQHVPQDSPQVFFLDFDPGLINLSSLIGTGAAAAKLSSFASFLPRWGLDAADLDAVIASVKQNVDRQFRILANRTTSCIVDYRIMTSVETPWSPHEFWSRILVAGDNQEAGIPNVTGRAEGIDDANRNMKDTAIVLPGAMAAAINHVPREDPANKTLKIAVVGRYVSYIIVHEIGHLIGARHTKNGNGKCVIMDYLDPEQAVGCGWDGIFGWKDLSDYQNIPSFEPDDFVEVFDNSFYFGEKQRLDLIAAFGLSTSPIEAAVADRAEGNGIAIRLATSGKRGGVRRRTLGYYINPPVSIRRGSSIEVQSVNGWPGSDGVSDQLPPITFVQKRIAGRGRIGSGSFYLDESGRQSLTHLILHHFYDDVENPSRSGVELWGRSNVQCTVSYPTYLSSNPVVSPAYINIIPSKPLEGFAQFPSSSSMISLTEFAGVVRDRFKALSPLPYWEDSGVALRQYTNYDTTLIRDFGWFYSSNAGLVYPGLYQNYVLESYPGLDVDSAIQSVFGSWDVGVPEQKLIRSINERLRWYKVVNGKRLHTRGFTPLYNTGINTSDGRNQLVGGLPLKSNTYVYNTAGTCLKGEQLRPQQTQKRFVTAHQALTHVLQPGVYIAVRYFYYPPSRKGYPGTLRAINPFVVISEDNGSSVTSTIYEFMDYLSDPVGSSSRRAGLFEHDTAPYFYMEQPAWSYIYVLPEFTRKPTPLPESKLDYLTNASNFSSGGYQYYEVWKFQFGYRP